MRTLDAFLQSISQPGIGAVTVPFDHVHDWLLANCKQLEFIKAEASGHGLQCDWIPEIDDETPKFLKFEKAKPWQQTISVPQVFATETESSISGNG